MSDEPKKSGFGGALAAGIVGAIVVLGGAAALQAGGYLPNLGAPEATDDTEFASQGDVESLNGEVASLRQALQDASDAAAANTSGESGDGSEALANLGQRIDALEESGSASGDNVAALKAAQDSTAAAQKTANEAGQTASGAQESATAAADTAKSAQQAADAAAQAANAAQQAADGANQTATETQTALGDLNGTIDTLTARLSDVEESNRQARIALAAANLKSAIDSGGPFMSQLESYARTAGDSETTGQLRGFAADGVPSEQALANRWPDARDRIASALAPQEPDAPVGDQFLSGLKSLVQVRPSGPAPAAAEGPQAALSRMDAAIESGDLGAWQEDWQTLPDAARQAGQDFAASVDARLTAQEAVSGALSTALSPTETGEAGASSSAPEGGSSASNGGTGNSSAPAAAPADEPSAQGSEGEDAAATSAGDEATASPDDSGAAAEPTASDETETPPSGDPSAPQADQAPQGQG